MLNFINRMIFYIKRFYYRSIKGYRCSEEGAQLYHYANAIFRADGNKFPETYAEYMLEDKWQDFFVDLTPQCDFNDPAVRKSLAIIFCSQLALSMGNNQFAAEDNVIIKNYFKGKKD